MKTVDERFEDLFDELVEPVGKSDSLAGEILRATAKINYRFYNDGDLIGVGYGKETCNPAARFLTYNAPKGIANLVRNMWGHYSEAFYESCLKDLVSMVVELVESDLSLRTTPTVDMYDFYDKDTDYDDDDCEDEWFDDEEEFEDDEDDCY